MSDSMENEIIQEDGTIVKYSPVGGTNSAAVQQYLDTVELQEVDELTGEITLRAVLPEHVLSQFLTCLRDRNWDLLYDQILSREARTHFESKDNGITYFQTFFDLNRRDIGKLLQRMIKGSAFGDVRQIKDGRFTIITIAPHSANDYRFKKITLVREHDFLKLYSLE
ncbi:MAG: hypothetical protein H8E86_00960 [Planctomycetes bacterium]|nr:hypothetical protein [Planctomycetota bacterium]